MPKCIVKTKNQNGQSLIEYALLVFFIATISAGIMRLMPPIMAKLEKPIRRDLKYTYKYGDPKTCGYDDTEYDCSGTPERHPRVVRSGNFRLFGRGD